MLKQKRQNEVEEAKSDKKSAMRKIRMRVKMESKKGKSAVCWIYQYSKKSLWLVILLALISGAIAGSFILLALVSSSLLDVTTGVKEGRLGVQIFLIVCLILLQAVLNIQEIDIQKIRIMYIQMEWLLPKLIRKLLQIMMFQEARTKIIIMSQDE